MPPNGALFNWDNIEKLKPGQTTERDAVQLIGEPIKKSRSSDGTVGWHYSYMPGQRICAFDMWTGGNTDSRLDHSHSLYVTFDAQGKLLRYSEDGGVTGILSGGQQ